MQKQYLEIGKIVNTHGVKGSVKAEAWCDSPSVLASLKRLYLKSGDSYSEIRIIKASVFKDTVILALEGVASVELALPYKGKIIYADRNDIKKDGDSFFIADLIGLDVIDADSGKVYGKVSDVLNLGASDLYEIKTENGKVLIPAVKEFVIRTDIESGIYIRPIDGMFE